MSVSITDPNWPDHVLDLIEAKAPESAPEPLGWPVGTLVHGIHSGRRGRIWSSHKNSCSIEFSDKGNIWFTTWDVVLRNYRKI